MTPSRKVSRRRFLRSAAAAVAAPYVLTSSALGGAGRPAASERITMGFIGVGGMGSGHVRSFTGRAEVQSVAVADVDARRRAENKAHIEGRYAAAAAAGTYAGCATYVDYREVLARDDIDAVMIATPDHWHAIIAVAACRAGKDVYCEKPLTLTIREARAIVRAARRYGRIFQTGSQQRSASNFRYACELVRNGCLGEVRSVHVGVGGPSRPCHLPAAPVPDYLEWDRWLGPAPWAPYHPERCARTYGGKTGWRAWRDYSGGMMTDWGAHHFDIAQWGLGMDDSGPVEITPPDGGDVKTLTYRYGNGVTMVHGGANGILFTGTEGKVQVNRGRFEAWPASLGHVPLGPDDVRLHVSNDHRGDFLRSVRTRRRPVADVEIGCRSVTVCHLGNIAYWLGRPLRWDPARETFLGDAEANRWLDRPKRAPYHL